MDISPVDFAGPFQLACPAQLINFLSVEMLEANFLQLLWQNASL
jgi:hypothetical protein